jgi:hypothetical protein
MELEKSTEQVLPGSEGRVGNRVEAGWARRRNDSNNIHTCE